MGGILDSAPVVALDEPSVEKKPKAKRLAACAPSRVANTSHLSFRRYNTHMRSLVFLLLLAGSLSWSAAQEPSTEKGPWSQQPPPADRDKEAGESSSRDTRIDLSPPKDDAKNHPGSATAVQDAESDASSGVQEFRPWNPHKAAKDIEVGDFYFKRKNYRAAFDRYREALVFKPDDALANYRLGQCFEKFNNPEEARTHYEAYLKILPHGPLSDDARKAIEKLKAAEDKNQVSSPPSQQ